MKRIKYLIFVLCYKIPGLLLKIKKTKKNMNSLSLKERYDFVRSIILMINKKARVHIHAYGLENLPKEQGYLLTPNHQGMFDALILLETHKEPIKTVYKKELQDTKIVNDILDIMEHLPIDRQNLRASMKVIKEVTRQLQEGMSFVIFPEGTRCRSQNKMLEFKGGTFKSAMDAHAPIVPVALIDCYKVFDENHNDIVDTQIHYLTPVTYDEYKDMSSSELAAYVQSLIQTCIDKNEHNQY